MCIYIYTYIYNKLKYRAQKRAHYRADHLVTARYNFHSFILLYHKYKSRCLDPRCTVEVSVFPRRWRYVFAWRNGIGKGKNFLFARNVYKTFVVLLTAGIRHSFEIYTPYCENISVMYRISRYAWRNSCALNRVTASRFAALNHPCNRISAL